MTWPSGHVRKATRADALASARTGAVSWSAVATSGIAEARITIMNYGMDMPEDTNETAEGRAKNRRLEFTIDER